MRSHTIATANAFIDLFPKGKEERQKILYKAEEHMDVILQHVQFAEVVFPDKGISICPVSHGISYFSKNCAHILGHTHEYLSSLDLSWFFQLIHPDDLLYVRQCYERIKVMEPYDPREYRFTIYYRLKNANGEYAHIKVENVAVSTGQQSYIYLLLYSDVTKEEKFHFVRMDVSKQSKGVFNKISSYHPRQSTAKMTSRQRDIATLIARGYANHEIAERLNVSIYTIKNHKQSLFKKVNVKNSIELSHFLQSSEPV